MRFTGRDGWLAPLKIDVESESPKRETASKAPRQRLLCRGRFPRFTDDLECPSVV